MFVPDYTATPLLAAHLAAGTIRFERSEYIAIGADGVELTIGTAYKQKHVEQVEAWLRDYPTQNEW